MSLQPSNTSAIGDALKTELRDIAIDLARRAGSLAMELRTADLIVDTKSSVTDVVTDADRAVEAFLISELSRLRPSDGIVGEERGQSATSNTGVRWVLDPIDGTVNFMLGFPFYAVSIAAEFDGVAIAGCVYGPAADQLFHAVAGEGAYLGEQRLRGPRSVPLDQSVVATGFGYDPGLRARQGKVVGELLARVGNLRRAGSAALDLCAIAAGWVDLYFEGPLNEWDIAAGALIAAEAGVQLSGLRGRPAGPKFIAGAHPDRAADFFGMLEELNADRH
jgi:myo-inositol-1(or 4)-monophosphatase